MGEKGPTATDGQVLSLGMPPGGLRTHVTVRGGPAVTLLGNRPVTGGYPVIGVVRAADVVRVAQLRPWQPVHFHLATGPQGRSTPAR